MKIYCPSHKRPDAPLFSISKNLIIVLQHEDEIEEYKRINEPRGHQIICIDTPGLLPARNWILEQNDNWSMQIDDDINEVFTWNKENKSYENTDWNTFIEYTEKVVNEVDHSKTGMIGYRFFVRGHIPKNNKEYEMTKTYFCLYQCVILNNKLLKSLNFKYEGFIHPDGDNNNLWAAEDIFLNYWCEDKKLDRIVINHVTFKSLWNDGENSVVWKNCKEYMSVTFRNQNIWLLERFKHNAELSILSVKNINQYLIKETRLKVFCPSHNRPDSKLFEITDGINIILQYKEDIESYSKWKNKHNVIYVPELNGLLDTRNWILEQNDDWVLMIDDDFLSYKRLVNVNDSIEEIDISWNDFLEEVKKITLELDDTKVGIIGFNNFNKKYTKQYQIEEDYSTIRSVILNTSLLKSKGFEYKSYPFDGKNGKKGYLEDIGLSCFCYTNNLNIIRINNLKFEDNNEIESIVWGDKKNKEKMLIVSSLWLLGKYYQYPKIINKMSKNIFYTLRKMNFNSIDDIVEEIVNVFSYENSNKCEEEFGMKKFLILGLIVLAGIVSLTSCYDKSQDNNGGDTKVIAEQYRGTFLQVTDKREGLILSQNTRQFIRNNEPGTSSPAYTDGVDLYVKYTGDNSFTKVGSFEDNDTLNIGTIYKREK